MKAHEKIKFVNQNASAEYLEKDGELYRRLFPGSKLNAELTKAHLYNKKDLDGRILLEMLDVICGDTVMENRGIVKDHKQSDEEVMLNTFMKVDLATAAYKDLKKWIKDLAIKPPDMKQETIRILLQAKQDASKAEPAAEVADAKPADIPGGASEGNADPEAGAGDEKKSEDPAASTQE